MLKSVLTKMVECIKTRNDYVVKGHMDAANRWVSKYEILDECMFAAGYQTKMETKVINIEGGIFEGLPINFVTKLLINSSKIKDSEIETFRAVGFKYEYDGAMMAYEF